MIQFVWAIATIETRRVFDMYPKYIRIKNLMKISLAVEAVQRCTKQDCRQTFVQKH